MKTKVNYSRKPDKQLPMIGETFVIPNCSNPQEVFMRVCSLDSNREFANTYPVFQYVSLTTGFIKQMEDSKFQKLIEWEVVEPSNTVYFFV